MRLYKLTFNDYTNALRDTISNKGKFPPEYITIKDGILYVAIEDIKQLEWFDNYGNGIKIAECLGGVMVLEGKKLFEDSG